MLRTCERKSIKKIFYTYFSVFVAVHEHCAHCQTCTLTKVLYAEEIALEPKDEN